jgi:NitT/TauT family transport system substrate-binding protein
MVIGVPRRPIRRLVVGIGLVLALAASGARPGPSPAQEKLTPVKVAVGGASCLCYLPTVLARQLGYYEQAGLDLELINFKGGSVALTAVLGGSADVVSGYYDHTVNIAAKNKAMKAIVVYDRFPGLVLVVSPKATAEVRTVKDLAGKKAGVSAPGSSTDFFLKHLLRKSGVDPNRVAVIGVGLDDTAVAAMEQGQVQAAVMLDPAVTLLQGRHPDLRILADTRTEADTRAVFGGDYPGGSLYAMTEWVERHPKESQALAEAIVRTLHWIHGHSAEEIMAKMPKEFVGPNPKLYLAALKNTIPMYSKTGLMDPKGAEAVLEVFSQSVPEIANARIDVRKTYTNEFVERANQKLGVSSR